MEFLLQQGHGMMALDKEFIRRDFASGVILSPRVYTPTQVEKHSQQIRALGGNLLFDPQFYQPHTGREKLLLFPYWRNLAFDTGNFDNIAANRFCEAVTDYQVNTLNVSRVLIPGRYTNSLSDSWLEMHRTFAESTASFVSNVPVYSTIAIGPDMILNIEEFNTLLDEITVYPVEGFYIMFRKPRDEFFINDSNLLYNLLDSFLNIRLQGKEILLGYANQQSIVFAAAGVQTLASGNFRNTRQFNPDIFDEQEQEIMQRGVWYYHPRTLSDFKVDSLGLAFRRGLADDFPATCEYCQTLLGGGHPGTIRWREPDAFRHFLYELNTQWVGLEAQAHRNVVQGIRRMLGNVRENIEQLRSRAFHLGERGFNQCIDSTMSAFEAFVADRSNDFVSL